MLRIHTIAPGPPPLLSTCRYAAALLGPVWGAASYPSTKIPHLDGRPQQPCCELSAEAEPLALCASPGAMVRAGERGAIWGVVVKYTRTGGRAAIVAAAEPKRAGP